MLSNVPGTGYKVVNKICFCVDGYQWKESRIRDKNQKGKKENYRKVISDKIIF